MRTFFLKGFWCWYPCYGFRFRIRRKTCEPRAAAGMPFPAHFRYPLESRMVKVYWGRGYFHNVCVDSNFRSMNKSDQQEKIREALDIGLARNKEYPEEQARNEAPLSIVTMPGKLANFQMFTSYHDGSSFLRM